MELLLLLSLLLLLLWQHVYTPLCQTLRVRRPEQPVIPELSYLFDEFRPKQAGHLLCFLVRRPLAQLQDVVAIVVVLSLDWMSWWCWWCCCSCRRAPPIHSIMLNLDLCATRPNEGEEDGHDEEQQRGRRAMPSQAAAARRHVVGEDRG